MTYWEKNGLLIVPRGCPSRRLFDNPALTKGTTLMSRKYQTTLAIDLNTKGEIELVKDAENGKLDPANAEEILAKLDEQVKLQRAKVNKWCYFSAKPDGTSYDFADKKGREGRTPVILANRFGKPYVAMMTPQARPAKTGPQRKRLA